MYTYCWLRLSVFEFLLLTTDVKEAVRADLTLCPFGSFNSGWKSSLFFSSAFVFHPNVSCYLGEHTTLLKRVSWPTKDGYTHIYSSGYTAREKEKPRKSREALTRQ